jgi:hypothetical protein
MTTGRLELSREQVLAYRRKVGALDERLPPGQSSLRHVAWAGLQDSVPYAALHSIHARMRDTDPATWQDPSLVQVWGPRFSSYVVSKQDLAVFTLGRLPESGATSAAAYDLAARLDEFLAGRSMAYRDAGRALGEHPNRLRYAALTGTVVIRWEGSGKPTIRTVPAPSITPKQARGELAARFLHVFGPAGVDAFAKWAGIRLSSARAAFQSLRESLTPTRTPIGDAWMLSSDVAAVRASATLPSPARLLPSGDAYFLLQGEHRSLLVPDERQRARLWTPRVWPGALLVDGEVAGTWRRTKNEITIETWHDLDRRTRAFIEEEASSMPIPNSDATAIVHWAD